MSSFSRGCGALLRELSGLPPFSSFPLPALTLCAAPHRAPHFSLCFFLSAAPQPTGFAAALLPPPPPLFLLMALTVRRRAVCALALLALLCGGCVSFVCGADAEEAQTTGDVNVSVEVSCPNTEKKLRWRVAGEGGSAAWNTCPTTPGGSEGSGGAAYSNSICLTAGSVYLEKFLTGKCPASQPTDGGDAALFTMNCTAAANSALHNLSKSEDGNVSINPTDNPLGASGGCEYPNFSQPAAEVQSGPQPQEQEQTAGPRAATRSSPQRLPAPQAPVKTAHEGNPSGVSRSVPGEPTAPAGLPGTVAGLTGSQEQSAEGIQKTPTPSVGTAASSTQTAGERAADAHGGTQTSSTTQGRSGTPNAAAPASDNDGITTTTAITRSPSDGSGAKSNADGSATNSNATQKAVTNAADRSATNALFVRASPLLLLTAVLACAAGQW
ncbi:mucin-like glycoprotein [Trypanosoma conorhini]|uniref:Mucin-like glycoprotein n=1 Tax=Trypanosoma conorhini TaxID=83891 RepID=A0A422MSN8_9TRYP|nr:mucin-like glycoprotein [Trypanosoma conorhini]RNE96255.1 mucin-like glycoprotein [Trypanosoma conorhini]